MCAGHRHRLRFLAKYIDLKILPPGYEFITIRTWILIKGGSKGLNMTRENTRKALIVKESLGSSKRLQSGCNGFSGKQKGITIAYNASS